MPIYGGDFVECLQTEVYRAIVSQYKAFNEPVIIYGCEATPGVDDDSLSITAGMALLDGDLIDVPAFNGESPVYLIQGPVTQILKNFKDQTPRPVMLVKTSVWVSEQPDEGDFIKFFPYTSQHLVDVQRRFLTPLNRCEWFPDFPHAAAFDGTGKGKWEWLGYAVANFQNGTCDLTGRVPAQFDPTVTPADPTFDMPIGRLMGEKKHQLTPDELAKFNVGRTRTDNPGTPIYEANHLKGGSDRGLYLEDRYFGNDKPHNNMQETIVGVWLQRIAYTL